MTKKYESSYAGYVYTKPKTYWNSEDEVKKKLVRVDFTQKGDLKEGGMPIISDGKVAYIDTSDAHTAICAISGMKKSICGFMPLIYCLARAKESMIITDPKGELYNRTSGYVASQGYFVPCLDFRTMERDGFNILEHPKRVYRAGDKDKGLMMLSDLVNVFADEQRQSGKCDVYWPNTGASWSNGTGGIMFESYPDDAVNIPNWQKMNTTKGAQLVGELASDNREDNTVMLNLETVLAEPEKTFLSTVSTSSSFFSRFVQNNKLARMLSNSTFNIEDLCERPTALYIITDDTSTTCDAIVSIILSQIKQYLVDFAYKNPRGELNRRVNFLLDEFVTIPFNNDEINRSLSTLRSRKIRFYLCIQSLAALKHRYPEYESLLANCGNILFMGSTEMDLLTRVSEQCGKTNITPDGREKPLISPAELMTLKKSWTHKEALYLNLGESIRYMTMLPSIEAYDLGNHPPLKGRIKHPKIRSYSISDLYSDIRNDKAHMPFTEQIAETEEEEEDEIKKKSPSNRKKTLPNVETVDEPMTEENTELLKELERKFDELFGAVDSDDD